MAFSDFSTFDIEQQFFSFMRSIDAAPTELSSLQIDGTIHRYKLRGDKGGEYSGAYCIFSDGDIPAGWAEDWHTGHSVSWCFDTSGMKPELRTKYNSQEFREDMRKKQEAERKERERKEKERADRTAQWCANRVKMLSPAPEDHPYLQKKRIFPYSALLENGGDYAGQNALAIPLTDIHGNIRGLQYILPDGIKRYERGIGLHGVFWSIALDTLTGSNNDTILLGEGFATMAKIYELTGLPCVAGLSCYGLKPAAEALHEKYPKARIIVMADNDREVEQKRDYNPGIEHAKKLVQAGLAYDTVWPEFAPDEEGTDWDDYAKNHGDENTQILLIEKIRQARIPPNIKAIEEKSDYMFGNQLISTIFPAVKWAVPGFLPAGLSILAGGPKIGKSFLALHLAIGVAIGGCVLGHIDVLQGDVLYLALEDTFRRLQDRILSSSLINEHTDLSKLCIFTKIPRQHLGGLEYLRYWLSEHDNTRLVIIDTLQMFRKQLSGKGSMYSEDYEAMSQIKTVADEFNVPFLILHHLKKGMEGDWVSELSGSQGIAGTADTIFTLKRERGSAMGTLHRTGRDVEEKDFIMKLDQYGWVLQGEADEFTTPEWKRQILDFLKENATISPMQLAEIASLPVTTARVNLSRLAKEGLIVKAGYGIYKLPDKQ